MVSGFKQIAMADFFAELLLEAAGLSYIGGKERALFAFDNLYTDTRGVFTLILEIIKIIGIVKS